MVRDSNTAAKPTREKRGGFIRPARRRDGWEVYLQCTARRGMLWVDPIPIKIVEHGSAWKLPSQDDPYRVDSPRIFSARAAKQSPS